MMKDILDYIVETDLKNYIKRIVNLKYEKDNSPLELKSFEIGIVKYDFDGEMLSKENGEYFYTNADGEKLNLDELTKFEDIHSLVQIVYFQNI